MKFQDNILQGYGGVFGCGNGGAGGGGIITGSLLILLVFDR